MRWTVKRIDGYYTFVRLAKFEFKNDAYEFAKTMSRKFPNNTFRIYDSRSAVMFDYTNGIETQFTYPEVD